MREDTLDDDDRTVDDDTEVDGAEAHQIGRDTEYAHENEGEEHRKRNDRGDDQAGAGVAEEYYEDDEDDDGALDKVADDGRNVTADKFRTVQIGAYRNALGQHLLYLLHAGLELFGYDIGICALEHHGYAADTLALAVACHGAETFCRSELDGPDVADVYGYAAAVCNDYLADVVQRGDHTLGTYVVCAVDLLDIAAARILVVAAQGIEYVAYGYVERVERVGIHGDLILLEIAAEAVYLDYAGYARQLALDDPVLYGTQLHGVVFVLISGSHVERILVYLAQTGGYGHHLGHAELRWDLTRDSLDLFVDELPRVEYRNALLEYDRDDREPETRYGTDLLDVHDVAHGNLYGKCDELLDLLRGECRRDGYDLYLVVGNIRYGVDRKREHRVYSACKQEECREPDE